MRNELYCLYDERINKQTKQSTGTKRNEPTFVLKLNVLSLADLINHEIAKLMHKKIKQSNNRLPSAFAPT